MYKPCYNIRGTNRGDKNLYMTQHIVLCGSLFALKAVTILPSI